MKQKKNKKKNWKTKALLVGLVLVVSWVACLKIGFEIKKYYNITRLPNSCFVDSMIYASQCNLLLTTNTQAWNTIYGFTFYYKDDKEHMLGHAVCLFEYNNNLWIYDPNWGTSPVCQIGDKKQYREKIRLYINQYYPIMIVEDFMLNDWTYVQKIKQNKMNKSYDEVSIYLDEHKKE